MVKPETEVDQVIDLSTLKFMDEPEDGVLPPLEAEIHTYSKDTHI